MQLQNGQNPGSGSGTEIWPACKQTEGVTARVYGGEVLQEGPG